MKRIVITALAILLILVGWIAFCGFQWGWGPFADLYNLKMAKLLGNARQYAPENVSYQGENSLKDKQIVFLGSSVTYGSASKGVSFADYLAARNGCVAIKEAISGTTLVNSGINSYVARLKKLDASQVDLLICQLSTNDATQNKPLGVVGESKNATDFDTATVAGAMEWIVSYAAEKWGCPVVFFTNPKYDSEQYALLVDLLLQIQNKWNIGVIDFWNNDEFNAITPQQRELYMADRIHPTQAGYLEWWTPAMEIELFQWVD